MRNFIQFLLLLCISTTPLFSQDVEDEWLVLDTTLFSVSYPSSWRLDQSGQYGTTFTINSPRDADEDQFSENLNLTIQDLTGYNLDFEAYIQISLEQIENMMENSVILRDETLFANGRQFHNLVYTSTQQDFLIQFDQYFWVIGNEAYLLTFSGEYGKAENYKLFKEKMLNSFLLK